MKKCIIITTINSPTEEIKRHIKNPEYDVIVVGDVKTPQAYKELNCIFLDMESQRKFFPSFFKLLPENHYSRKNIGYLYALKNNYEVIYETDDDTGPLPNFEEFLNFKPSQYKILSSKDVWINFFKYFTNDFIWPRGYPLSLIGETDILINENQQKITPSIISGLIGSDPDVDSIYRLVVKKIPSFKKKSPIIIDNQNMCVFNTQNTFWLNKSIFPCLFIPSTVSFRYCDILRGIITNVVLKYMGLNMGYISKNVVQNRNKHNLMQDFISEIPMFIGNENILDFIQDSCDNGMNVKDLLRTIYANLFDKNYISKKDVVLLEKWLNYFKGVEKNANFC
jgi:hypothetical protein